MKLVLINGSPRRKKAHYIFCRTMKELAEAAGHEAVIYHAIDFWEGKTDFSELKSELAVADILGMFTPLYVDTLPAAATKLIEALADDCSEELRGMSLFAVSGSGFPDFRLFQTVYGICDCFARSTGMVWLGGMGYVATPMQDGRNPADMGKRGRSIIAGLQIALDAVLEGRVIPAEAEAVFAIHLPAFVRYLMPVVMNSAARKSCKKLGTDLYARPHL